jgi:putative ABC transport system substrate-binding protein
MRFNNLCRREFMTLLGGAVASSVLRPFTARAQQAERMRRIGWLTSLAADDPVPQTYIAALLQALQELGWTVGRNVRIDYRWGATNAELKRRFVAELIALAPDVIVTIGDSNTAPLLGASRTVPIVFVLVPDPVGAGFVASLARPGGNATGFMNFELGMSGKWPELLKQIAPSVTRMAVLRDPTAGASMGQLGAIHAVVPSLRVEASPIDLRDAGEIERAIADFARTSNGGLIVLPSGLSFIHRELIIGLAARHRLPAVYPFRLFIEDGGLICYGPDAIDQLRRAAGYVDRILKGEKAADLPVQAPTRYELVINRKTAKALGLDVPTTLLARADEVIE